MRAACRPDPLASDSFYRCGAEPEIPIVVVRVGPIAVHGTVVVHPRNARVHAVRPALHSVRYRHRAHLSASLWRDVTRQRLLFRRRK